MRFILFTTAMMIFSLANAAGPITQLIWTTTPASVTQGIQFGSVTVKTADASSVPSTVNLPAVKIVTLAVVSGSGQLSGVQTANIGASGGNGTVTFSGLTIDQPTVSLGGGSVTLQVSDEGSYLPTNITAGASCQLWLDAADFSSLMMDASGSYVTNWVDKSGLHNNATNTIGGAAGIATNCPTRNINYAASSLTSQYAGLGRTVNFPGNPNGNTAGSSANFGLHMNLSSLAGTNYTVIALDIPAWTYGTNHTMYVIGNDGTGNTDLNLHLGYNGGFDFHWGQYGDDYDATGIFAQYVPMIWEAQMAANKLETLYTNGLTSAQQTTYYPAVVAGTPRTAGGFLLTNNLALGRVGRAQGGNNFNGDIAEIMVFNSGLSTQDRTNLENYLLGKWYGVGAVVNGTPNYLQGAQSSPITINASPITSLNFLGTINTAVEGVAITSSVGSEIRVKALNGSSPVVGATVYLTIASGPAALISGSVSAVTDASGIAHFPTTSLNLTGAYTLQATSSGMTGTSPSFNITAGAPVSLSVETAPDGSGTVVPAENVVADSSITVYAITRDSQGNFAANVSATWSLINTTAINGVGVVASDLVGGGASATFTGHYAGTGTIQAVASSMTGQSGLQTVVGTTPVALAFFQVPSLQAGINLPFGVPAVVALVDHYGNPSSSSVSIAASATGPGNLNGTTTQNTVNGSATFGDLNFDTLGAYNLTFTYTSFTVSATVTVVHGNASVLVWTTQPSLATNGLVFRQDPVLATYDSANEVTTAGLPNNRFVKIQIYSGAGVLTGTIITNIGVNGGNGSVTLPDLRILTNGTFQLVAYDFGNGLNPTNIAGGTNCQLWLDAADVTTYLTNTTRHVTNWLDKSGIHNNAVQTTSGNAPRFTNDLSFAPGLVGGQLGLQFISSSSMWMRINLSSAIGTDFTIVYMEDNLDTNNNSHYIFGCDGGQNDETLHTGYGGDNLFRFNFWNDDLGWSPSSPAIIVPPVLPTLPRLWTLNCDPSRVKIIYSNYLAVAQNTSGSLLQAGNLQNGSIGRAAGGTYMLGNLAEVLFYDHQLSGTDRTNIQDYLNVKWKTGMSNAITLPFTVQSSPISTISFVSPGINNASAGASLSAAALGEVQVQVVGASANPLPGIVITLNLASGTGVVSQNTAVTDNSGIAHFANASINKSGTKTLVATSVGTGISSVASGSFVISPTAGTFITLDTAADGSGSIIPAEQVPADTLVTAFAILRDANSNFVSNVTATWSLINMTAANGVGVVSSDLVPAGDNKSATFTGHFAGTAQIQAVGTFTSVSGVQTVVGGTATAIAMYQQPSGTAQSGVPFTVQPVVRIMDHYANTVLGSGTNITASETTGGNLNAGGRNAGGIVAPITASTAASGLATFSGLFITNTGASTLTFTATGLISTNSTSIVVSVGPAQQLVWVTQPGLATNGLVLAQSPVVQTADAGGNPSTAGLPAVKMVQVAIYSGNGVLSGILLTNIGTSGGNGTISFTNLQLSTPGTVQLVVSDAGFGFNPTNESSQAAANCFLWLDAADLNAFKLAQDGITVTNWLDKSGTGNNADTNNRATPIGLFAPPILVTNTTLANQMVGLNGNGKVVRFNGSSQSLGVSMMSISNTPFTIFTVETTTGKSGAAYVFGNNGSTGNDMVLQWGYNSTTSWQFGMDFDDLGASGITLANPLPRVETAKLASSKQRNIYFNGSSIAQNNAGNFLVNGQFNRGSVGSANNGTYYLGDLCELVAYKIDLSDTDRLNIENYLETKWMSGLQGAVSVPFTVAPLPIGSVALVSPTINNTAAGGNITAAALGEVQVKVLSQSSIPLPGVTVTVTLTNGTGPISGNVAVTDNSGIAHFNNLTITTIGTKQIIASTLANQSPGSSLFQITAAAVAVLNVESAANGSGIVIPTENLPAGVPNTFYAITRDQYNNFVANVSATWSLVNITGGVVSGDLAPASGTSATFTGHLAGSTIVQASASLIAYSGTLTVIGGAPATISITTQPGDNTTLVGAPLPVQPVMTVYDAFGNIDPTNTVVTATETSGGSLNDSLVPPSVNLDVTGTATFSGLFVTNTGSVSLTFSAGTIHTQSTSFTVNVGNVARFVWSTQPPSTAQVNTVLSSSPVLQTADLGGHPTTLGLSSTRNVTIGLYGVTGGLAGTLTGNIGTSGTGGTLTLPNLQILQGGVFQLVAVDSGDGTSPLTIADGASCQLWLDASDLSTLTLSGTNVTTWADKSGKANNATDGVVYDINPNTLLPSSTGTSPSVSRDTLLSLISGGQGQVVHFDGVANVLGMNLSSLAGTPYTILAEIVPSVKLSASSYFIGDSRSYQNSSVGGDNCLHFGWSSYVQLYWGQYGDDLGIVMGTFTTPATLTALMDSSKNRTVYSNTVPVGSRTGGNFLNSTYLSEGNIGTGFEAGDNYFGDIAEIMVFNTGLSTNEFITMQNYLNNKWMAGTIGAVSASITVPNPTPSVITSVSITGGVGGNLIVSGTNGTPSGSFHVQSTTNLSNQVWIPVYTGTADSHGNFISAPIPTSAGSPDTFYRVVVP